MTMVKWDGKLKNDLVGESLFLRKLLWASLPNKRQTDVNHFNAFGGPSRPATRVAYPTRGMRHGYAMTRRDVVKPAFSLRSRSVKTHALSLPGTTRLLSRSGCINACHDTVEQTLLLHKRIIDQSGGSMGVCNQGLLESALAQPCMSYAGQELYPSLNRKSCRARFFVD